MAEEVQLTTAQTEKLLQFQDLTAIEDLDQCRTLLENHNWDMEVAVQDTFNLQEGIPSVFDASSINIPTDVLDAPEQRQDRPLREPAQDAAAYQQALLADQEKERQKEREGSEGTQRH